MPQGGPLQWGRLTAWGGVTSMLPRRYSVREAAVELDYSPATVTREIALGNLRCYRLGPKGKIIQIGRHHLEEYLACRETRASAALATTSSASDETAASGAPVGTMHVVDKRSAVASARTTFAPRKSSSPPSSPDTAKSVTPSPPS